MNKKAATDGKAGEVSLGHVLLVEDDAVLSLSLEQELLAAGINQVTIVATAVEALATLREVKPDAVILDVHLADSSVGWEIAELLSAIGPKPPKIIFSTGAPEDIPEDVAALGPVLEKPFDPAALIALLKEPRRRGFLARLRKPEA